jgi:hypothetical protein
MKRVNCFMMLAAAFALTAGVTSCNRNETIETGEIKPGEPTSMEISISAPRAPQTFAATDANATDGEIGMTSVNVLIYAETLTPGTYVLEQNAALASTDFTLGAPDKYTATSSIATTTGNKKLYVVMNYPASGVTSLPAVGSLLTYLPDFVSTLTAANTLSSADDKFTMSSVEEKTVTLVAETTPGTTPAGNKVDVTVKRLVAKVTVMEGPSLRSGGNITDTGGAGTFTNPEFAVGNINKKIYLFQKTDGISPNIVVKDPNWTLSTYAAGDFFSPVAPASYQSVDASGTGVLSLKTAYAPENTADTYSPDGKNLTYISVRAEFKPDFFCDAAGTPVANSGPVVPFWTVTKSDGTILYFDDHSDATTFQGTSAGSILSAEYEDGLCYFRAYINKNGVADATIAGSIAARFDVLRNNYYQATITGIKAPGSHEDEGKVEDVTSLMVDITVQPWQMVSDSYDLH